MSQAQALGLLLWIVVIAALGAWDLWRTFRHPPIESPPATTPNRTAEKRE